MSALLNPAALLAIGEDIESALPCDLFLFMKVLERMRVW